METKSYKGKIILFGEYSVIYGSPALLIPYYPACARLEVGITDKNSFFSNKSLKKFYEYLSKNELFVKELDLDLFFKELNLGLYLKSNIPHGYGVGSSGALVAAVYDRYHLSEIRNHVELKYFLAQMENCFHSSSSGIDPLQCYYGQPFAITKQQEIIMLGHDFIPNSIHVFLIDTKVKSNTAPLVAYFREQRKNEQYLESFNNEYLPCVGDCIGALIGHRTNLFFEKMALLSQLQTELLRPMITDNTINLFEAKVAKEHYQVKICGSGGGGYLLGFADNKEIAENNLKEKGFTVLWL